MSELNNGDVTDVLDSFFIDYAIEVDHVLTGENLFKIHVEETEPAERPIFS